MLAGGATLIDLITAGGVGAGLGGVGAALGGLATAFGEVEWLVLVRDVWRDDDEDDEREELEDELCDAALTILILHSTSELWV